MPQNPDRLGSSSTVKSYATIASDIDVKAVFDGPCRWFTVGTAGDLVVDTAGGSVGETITCVTGQRYEVQVTKVTAAGSTAAKVTFYK